MTAEREERRSASLFSYSRGSCDSAPGCPASRSKVAAEKRFKMFPVSIAWKQGGERLVRAMKGCERRAGVGAT